MVFKVALGLALQKSVAFIIFHALCVRAVKAVAKLSGNPSMKYHAFFISKIRKETQNLLSAAVVIGALRGNCITN